MKLCELPSGELFIVDEFMAHLLKGIKWHLDKSTGYVIWNKYLGRINGKEKYQKVYLHRYLVNTPKGYVTDHVNGDKLDNRIDNLRICRQQQNCFNSRLSKNNRSGYTGVYWSKVSKKWAARIMFNRRTIHLGVYSEFQDAVLARKEAEKKNFGVFAPQH